MPPCPRRKHSRSLASGVGWGGKAEMAISLRCAPLFLFHVPIRSDRIRPYQARSNKIRSKSESDQGKSDPIRSDPIRSNQTKFTSIQSNQIKPDQNQIKSGQIARCVLFFFLVINQPITNHRHLSDAAFHLPLWPSMRWHSVQYGACS
ncbi:unnamed protein product [Discosporangium mesarthrocarpum]